MAQLVTSMIIEVIKEFELKGTDGQTVKNDRVFRMEIPIGSPFAEAVAASQEMTQVILEIAKQAEDKAKAQTGEAPAAT